MKRLNFGLSEVPDIKQFYPDNWDDIRSLVLHRARMRIHRHDHFGGPTRGELAFNSVYEQCEKCAITNGQKYYRHDNYWFGAVVGSELGKIDDNGVIVDRPDRMPDDAKPVDVVLTIAHLNHDPTDNSADNLAALCQRCHLEYDNRPEQRERRRKVYAELLGQESFDGLSALEVEDDLSWREICWIVALGEDFNFTTSSCAINAGYREEGYHWPKYHESWKHAGRVLAAMPTGTETATYGLDGQDGAICCYEERYGDDNFKNTHHLASRCRADESTLKEAITKAAAKCVLNGIKLQTD